MILKTYKAHDLPAALARAREELGADALVLARSEVRGPLGLPAVEVTVAAARPPAAAPAPELPAAPFVAPRPLPRRPAEPARGAPELAPLLSASVDVLIDAGLTSDLARRFAHIAARDLDGRIDARRLAGAAARAMADLVPLCAPPQGRVAFVVGPPGSGKTTTVAKLVARHAGARRLAFFAQADTDRIGAVEQAEIYARHIGAVLARLDGPDDLERALADAGAGGAVVVDTPGIGAGDDERLRAVARLRDPLPEADVVVLLPAGLNRAEAARALARFDVLRPTCVALTRTDDGARPGEVVSVLAERGLPLAFVTTGHGVPHDIEDASARRLAALLLRTAAQRTTARAGARP